MQGGRRLGTLYLESDLGEIYEHFQLFVAIGALFTLLAFLAAYLISRRLQARISGADPGAGGHGAAGVRAARLLGARRDMPAGHEFGQLTDAFNHMLTRIEDDQTKLQSQLSRLTCCTESRARPASAMTCRASSAWCCATSRRICRSISAACASTSRARGAVHRGDRAAAATHSRGSLGLAEESAVPIDQNGLARCVAGELVYEPDTRALNFPFPQRFAQQGMHALVIAPLLVEKRVFGVLVAARRAADSFSSADCEFLRQLSEHVALGAHQAQLYGALQRAYDDLRQSQQAIMQQERLRALGEMASGIAHDINNAISPVALYTESLLEREPDLSRAGARAI